MAYSYSQPWEQDARLAVLAAPDPSLHSGQVMAWDSGPAPVAPAAAEEHDDWSGVLGACHALRPGAGNPAPAAVLDAFADWGYDAHAI